VVAPAMGQGAQAPPAFAAALPEFLCKAIHCFKEYIFTD